MSWIDDVPDEALRTIVKNTKVCVLASKTDGSILWANRAMCEWSGYTLSELIKLGWKNLSAQTEDLVADLAATDALTDYQPTFQIQKQYVPKNDKPAWGVLSVMKYPSAGPIEFAFCIWEPLKNGTATAFHLAMESHSETAKAIDGIKAELAKMTTQTHEQRFLLATFDMITRHPKIALAFVVIALSIFGINNVLELLQRAGVVQLPTVNTTTEQPHAALQINTDSGSWREVETPGGSFVRWEIDTNARSDRPMLRATERTGSGIVRAGQFAGSDSGSGRSSHSL